MLYSLRASRRALKIPIHFKNKPKCIFCLQTNCFKLHDDIPPILFHSIFRIQGISHFPIPKEDYTVNKDVARANWTITTLCREGRLSDAHQLFDEMPERDVITWTALISGYIKSDMIEEARALFDRIDALTNVVAWTAMISGYLKSNAISEAEKLFDEMSEKNVVAWNTMIEGYVKGNRIEQALKLFSKMEERNIVSWHVVIAGLMNGGRVAEARALFDQMPVRNVVSWTIMVSGLARNGQIDQARLLFNQMPDRNIVSWNAMVTGYVQNMRFAEAFDLFVAMPERNVQSWNIMITGFTHNGELAKARKLFDDMPRKNVISWTTMLSGYTQFGENEEAFKLFIEMKKDKHAKPNEGTFVSIFGACNSLGDGMQVHQVISKTVYRETKFVISALINMYSKCGDLAMAKQVFDETMLKPDQDLVTWNSMISAYAHHGFGREAIAVFNEMQTAGLKPNDVTYVGLLSACSHAGLVQEGLNYFEALCMDESVKLREDHYTCIVDLYSRAGRLKDALDFLKRAPMRVSSYTWGALLTGCNVHGNADVGKLVADKVLQMEPENSGMYVHSWNMYTIGGKLNEAEMVKAEMKGRRLKKQPGCSWIEVGNEVRVFVVGYELNREIGDIQLLLANLHDEMKNGVEEDDRIRQDPMKIHELD